VAKRPRKNETKLIRVSQRKKEALKVSFILNKKIKKLGVCTLPLGCDGSFHNEKLKIAPTGFGSQTRKGGVEVRRKQENRSKGHWEKSSTGKKGKSCLGALSGAFSWGQGKKTVQWARKAVRRGSEKGTRRNTRISKKNRKEETRGRGFSAGHL